MRSLCVLLLLLVGSASVSAQNAVPGDDAPLLLWSAGNLYLVDASNPEALPAQLTQSGVISGVVLSPDGSRIAYREAAPVGIEALGRLQSDGPIAEFDLPADILTLDLTTGLIARVAGQPANASLFVEGVPDTATVRSAPSWSPEGNQLAWMELAFGSATAALVLHDFRNGLTGVVPVDVPVTRGAAPEAHWGAGGIAISAGELMPGEQSFYIYTTDGLPRSTAVVRPATGESLEMVTWVDNNGESLFGALFSSGRWALIDPATGTERSIDGVPQLYSAANPGDSLALRFGVDGELGYFWETLDPRAGEFSGAFPSSPERTTLAPGGRAVIFLGYPSYTGAAIWTDSAGVVPVAGTGSGQLEVGGVTWGPTAWRIGPLSPDPAGG